MLSAKRSEQLTEVGKNTWNITLGAHYWQLVSLIFIVAKIFNYITWSWWWVFAPIWGPFALVLGVIALIAVIFLLIYLVCTLLDKVIPWYKGRRKKKGVNNG